MAEKLNKTYRVINVVGSSFIKRLSNADHAHFMMEFIDLLPHGLYDNKRPLLTQLVNNEVENINNCRKNHNREVYNSKIGMLKSVMSALYRILVSEAKAGHQGAAVEVHSYEVRVMPEIKNKGYLEAVSGFLHAWAGTESRAAEALVDDARDLCEELRNVVQFMMMEDLMIKNIEAQIVYRESTDALVFDIIAKASIENYELSPTIESEVERLEQVNEFLEAWIGFVERIRISVKNSGPEPGEEPEPLSTVKDHNFPVSASEKIDSEEAKMSRSIREMVYNNIKSEDGEAKNPNDAATQEERQALYQKQRAQKLDAYEIADQVMKNVVAKYGSNLTDEELQKYSQEEYALLTADEEE